MKNSKPKAAHVLDKVLEDPLRLTLPMTLVEWRSDHFTVRSGPDVEDDVLLFEIKNRSVLTMAIVENFLPRLYPYPLGMRN